MGPLTGQRRRWGCSAGRTATRVWGTDSQRFRLQVTPELIWVTREETGRQEEQPRGRDATGARVRAGTGVLARASPAPKAGREAWAGSALGSQRQIRPSPHPQGLTDLWETDIGHNCNLMEGFPQAWRAFGGPSRPWGDGRSDRGIMTSKFSEAGPLC